jgi:hypothetical protein
MGGIIVLILKLNDDIYNIIPYFTLRACLELRLMD